MKHSSWSLIQYVLHPAFKFMFHHRLHAVMRIEAIIILCTGCFIIIAFNSAEDWEVAKSAKFVGCKIGDMRSFWYPGFLWCETVRVIRDSCAVGVFWVHVKIWSPFPSSPLRSFKLRQEQQFEVSFKNIDVVNWLWKYSSKSWTV